MLKIENLKVKIKENDKTILHGINLEIADGTLHAIMGPNGSGKSTLANVLVGNDDYEVTEGKIEFNGVDLLKLTVEERALAGLFLALQNPIEIPGVNNVYFLRTAFNSLQKQKGQEELDAFDFMQLVKEKIKVLNLDESFLKRSLNAGFSGGEKKRNEMLQMLVLEPAFAVLDEIDSGLDVDALKIVAKAVNNLRDDKRSFLVVTHYQRLLNYIVPDFVHVLSHGKIVKSGGKELALELEKKGFAEFE